jgi:hypothetical protein
VRQGVGASDPGAGRASRSRADGPAHSSTAQPTSSTIQAGLRRGSRDPRMRATPRPGADALRDLAPWSDRKSLFFLIERIFLFAFDDLQRADGPARNGERGAIAQAGSGAGDSIAQGQTVSAPMHVRAIAAARLCSPFVV